MSNKEKVKGRINIKNMMMFLAIGVIFLFLTGCETLEVKSTWRDQDIVIERVSAPPVIDPDLAQLRAALDLEK